MLENLADSMLSREQMKAVKGGWCYYFFCNCGGTIFSGVGDLNAYIGAVHAAGCGPGVPVQCNFGESHTC